MNQLIEFADNNRTTEYFKDYAIAQIKIAYRIMEYLAPDIVYPAKNLEAHTKTLMLQGNYAYAYERVYNETPDIDCGSSQGSEALRRDAIELMKHLLPRYIESVTDAKERRKLELLKELRELEA